MGNVTTDGGASLPNAGFDANGLPTVVYAPGQTNPTTYQYDADGNLLAVTDPRNPSPSSLGGQQPTQATITSPYTTYHAYDALNELVETWSPKSSSSGVWIQDLTQYDPNGNVIQTSVGNDGATPPTVIAYAYTAMDQETSKTVQAVPTSEASAPGGSTQTTTYCYNLDQNLTDEVLPAGQTGSTPCPIGLELTNCPTAPNCASGANHAVHYVLDGDGEVLVQEQLTNTPGTQDQLTSNAYDARGNEVASADAVDNAGQTWQEAIANAQSALSLTAGPWRTMTVYDPADEPIDQVTNPDRSDGTIYQALSQYDAAGNLLATESPKEVNAGNSQSTQTIQPTTGEYGFAGDSDMTNYAYDGRNLMTSVTTPDGDETLYGRQADGKICWIMSPNSVQNAQQNGGLPSETACTGSGSPSGERLPWVTDYTYTAQGWLAQMTLPKAPGEYAYPSGQMQLSYSYDPVGDPWKITTPDGNTMTNTFYDTGDLESTTMPWWWTTYDPQGTNDSGADPNTGGQGQLAPATSADGLVIRQKPLSAIYRDSSPFGGESRVWAAVVDV